MTVSSEVNRSGPYIGNGVTTIFPYGFKIVDEDHLRVIRAESGVETVLVVNIDYIVSGVGDSSGGQIACTAAPTAEQTVTILLDVPFTQEIDLENQGAYYAETVERGLDLAAMRDKQLSERLDRAVTVPASASADDLNNLIADVLRVADSADSIDTVAGIAGQVVTVAGIASDVTTVAGIAGDVSALAENAANIEAVAAIDAAVTTVAGIAADVTTTAGIAGAVAGVSANAANISAVAAVDDEVSTVAGNIASVNQVAADTVVINKLAGLVGDPVGTSDNQTLTGKTIDGDDNTLRDIALGSLKDQANNTILANVSGGVGKPGAKTITEALDALLGNVQGAIIYRAAGSWTKLDPGTSGRFLKTLGPNANPTWDDVSGAGTVPDRSIVFAGVADCRIVTDAAMNASSATLTSATANFTSGDVGKVVSVAGAGAAGNALVAAITVFTNSTTVTVSAAATGTVSGARLAIGTNNSTALGTAITAAGSGANIIIPNGNYLFLNQIALPQGKRIRFTGSGAGSTALFFGSDAAAFFNYTRTSGQVDAIYEFFDLTFYTVSMAKKAGSAALYSYGYSDADALNMLRVHRCWFFGWEKGITSKWTGQSKVHNCYFSQNTYSVFMLRGCSFWDFNANMSGDATFLYAVDTTHDAYSNGLFIRSCQSVNNTAESIVIEGYQAVWIAQTGFDLGSGGQAAILFTAVMDFTIEACYISSNNSTTRAGVSLTGCVRGHIAFNTIVNNNQGVFITGVNGTATRITTFDNTFDGQDKNDIVWSNYATCCKHIANHHSKQMSRTGTNYEVYGNITGVDFGVIAQNTFKGTTYTITAGASTQQANNIFGVTAG